MVGTSDLGTPPCRILMLWGMPCWSLRLGRFWKPKWHDTNYRIAIFCTHFLRFHGRCEFCCSQGSWPTMAKCRAILGVDVSWCIAILASERWLVASKEQPRFDAKFHCIVHMPSHWSDAKTSIFSCSMLIKNQQMQKHMRTMKASCFR